MSDFYQRLMSEERPKRTMSEVESEGRCSESSLRWSLPPEINMGNLMVRGVDKSSTKIEEKEERLTFGECFAHTTAD